MDEGNQIFIPPSFSALYVPPGKIKPTLKLLSWAWAKPTMAAKPSPVAMFKN